MWKHFLFWRVFYVVPMIGVGAAFSIFFWIYALFCEGVRYDYLMRASKYPFLVATGAAFVTAVLVFAVDLIILNSKTRS